MNNLDHKLPECEFNLACPTVRKNRSFHYRTKLSFERMCQISDWIGSLTPEQKDMLEDVIFDARDDATDKSD